MIDPRQLMLADPQHRGPTQTRTPARPANWSSVTRQPWTPDAARDLVVVCPHPDDEALGCGGLILRQHGLGRRVTVLAVTDGEAAYPASWPALALARTRRIEHDRSFAVLGVSEVVRLGVPDGEVAHHESLVRDALQSLLSSSPDALVLAPWPFDGHPDHEACGRATGDALHRTEAELLWYLVWGWFRSDVDDQLPARMKSLSLTAQEIRSRAAAVELHESQRRPDAVRAIVSDEMVTQLLRSSECYIDP